MYTSFLRDKKDDFQDIVLWKIIQLQIGLVQQYILYFKRYKRERERKRVKELLHVFRNSSGKIISSIYPTEYGNLINQIFTNTNLRL